MTLKEVEYKISYYRQKVEEYESMKNKMTAVLELKDYEKPFKKWTMQEQQNLFDINEKAFDWLVENSDSSIYDYNDTVIKEKQVVLKG